MSNSRKVWTAVAVLIALVAGVTMSSSGHRVLNALGLTGACNSDDGCN